MVLLLISIGTLQGGLEKTIALVKASQVPNEKPLSDQNLSAEEEDSVLASINDSINNTMFTFDKQKLIARFKVLLNQMHIFEQAAFRLLTKVYANGTVKELIKHACNVAKSDLLTNNARLCAAERLHQYKTLRDDLESRIKSIDTVNPQRLILRDSREIGFAEMLYKEMIAITEAMKGLALLTNAIERELREYSSALPDKEVTNSQDLARVLSMPLLLENEFTLSENRTNDLWLAIASIVEPSFLGGSEKMKQIVSSLKQLVLDDSLKKKLSHELIELPHTIKAAIFATTISDDGHRVYAAGSNAEMNTNPSIQCWHVSDEKNIQSVAVNLPTVPSQPDGFKTFSEFLLSADGTLCSITSPFSVAMHDGSSTTNSYDIPLLPYGTGFHGFGSKNK